MANDDLQQAVASIREMVLAHDAAGVSDSLLLKLFLSEHDESAFEALVRRHGPMVYGVCKRVLPNTADAEDAFQATFLVFVRKAALLAQPDLLGNWLYGVAFHTARSARSAANRRRAKEGQVIPKQAESAPVDLHDLLPILDEELNRLPPKHRAPIVLCDLEQKSRKEVAHALDLPEGTLASRLARARALLAKRLTRRGVTLGGATLAVALSGSSTAPASALVQVTVKAGTALLAGQTVALGLGSASAIILSETVIKMMLLSKLKFVGAVCLGGALFTTGVGVLTAQHWRGTVALEGAADVPNLAGLSNNELADTSLLQQTLDAAAAIEDPVDRLKLLLRVAQAQLDAGDRAGVSATAEKSLALARGLEDGSEKVRFLCSIARMQNEAGQRQKSRATVQDAEKIALAQQEPVEKPGEIGIGLYEVAQLLSSWAEYDECLVLAEQSGNRKEPVLRALARMVRPDKGAEVVARQALQRAADMAAKAMKVDPKEARVPFMRMNRAQEVIAAAQARIGDLEDALKTVEAIHYPGQGDTRLGEPFGNKGNALSAIARELARAGDFQGALKTAAQVLKSDKFTEEIRRLIAMKQAEDGDFEGALKTAADLSSVQEKANVIRTIAVAQIEKGDRKGGQARLEELRRLNESSQDTARNTQSFSVSLEFAPRTAQADIEARLGDFKEALKTAGNLTGARDKAQSLLAIGRQMLVVGKKEEARQVLRRASRSAERIPEQASEIRRGPEGRSGRVGFPRTEKPMILFQVAVQQARAGDAEGAFETAESLPSNSDVDWLLIALAEGGDIDGAVESLGKLRKTEAKERALEGIANIMTKAGKEQEAAALAAKQKRSLLRAYTLLGMALGKAKVTVPREE